MSWISNQLAKWRKPLFVDECRAMTVDEWAAWKQQMLRQHPVRYFLFESLPISLRRARRRFLTDPWWWLRHRLDPRRRYHVIRTELRPGYYDPSTRILYGVLSLVAEFVDKTRHTVDWDADEGHAEAWRVFTHATVWFVMYKARGNDLTLEEEDRWELKGNMHLEAIMKNRGYLWYP